MTGFDAGTGQVLWKLPGAIGGVTQPLLWKHGGREYVIVADQSIKCFEPKAGKVLWSVGPVSHAGYEASAPAIQGDYIVAHGSWTTNKAEENIDQIEGWVCYKMTPAKAEKVWSLNGAYKGVGYNAPAIHRGYAWLPFGRDKGVSGAVDSCDAGSKDDGAIVCVEMATGKVMSEMTGLPINSTCPGISAMGDRLFNMNATQVWMMDIADPKAPKYMGAQPEPVNLCSSVTAADGFMYLRSAERLVVALDLREPASRPKRPTRHDDVANALFEITVPAARVDGKDVLFSFRGRDGAFRQSWAQALAPGYAYPDVFDCTALVLKDKTVAGRANAYMQAQKYEYDVNLALADDGTVKGTFQDLYQGMETNGVFTGTVRPPVTRDGVFKISWNREWCGGGAAPYDFQMYVDLKDGVFGNIQFKPNSPTAYDVVIRTNTLQMADGRLTGTIVLDQRKMIKGLYTLTFDAGTALNRPDGKVLVQRDGGAGKEYRVWGEVTVPESDKVDPENAEYILWLDKCIPKVPGLRIWMTAEKGRALPKNVTFMPGCAGLQQGDLADLRIAGNRVSGTVRAVINGDGYNVKDRNLRCEYVVDATTDGKNITGTFKGYYDRRDPKKMEVAGCFFNP